MSTAPRLVGARIPRVNDDKFLDGAACYVDDMTLPGMLHAAIVRSPVPHGVLRGLDVSGVSTAVQLVIGPDDAQARAGEMPVLARPPGLRQTAHPVVGDRVRYVGEAIGVAVAASRYAAEDAVDAVVPDIDELPPVADAVGALVPGAPLLYPEWGTNVVADVEFGDSVSHTEAVFARAARRLRTEIRVGRLAGAPMECRGIVAVPDTGTGRITVWTATQAPHNVRDVLAAVLGVPQGHVRVIAPDVGGGFGVKDHLYEDEALVCLAALRLGRPVKWIEDRRESLTVTAQARGDVHDVEIAFEDDGRLLGLRTHSVRDCGGYLSIFGPAPLQITCAVLPGPYRWEAIRATGQAVVTNSAPTGAYRGFGQPQAVFIRERMVDLVAADLGEDPVDVRLRNMIGAAEQPYTTRTHLTYDGGDYPATLRQVSEMMRAGSAPPSDGRARGVGYSSYVEACAVGPSSGQKLMSMHAASYETATVRMDNDGSVRVYVGTSPHGQGHETTFAQVCADRLGVPLEAITLVHSDTDSTPYSPYGTAASRSMALGGGAVVRASEKLAAKLRAIAAHLVEANADDIELRDGMASVAGTAVSLPIAEVARNGLRGWDLPEGMEPGLTETFLHDPANISFSYATHACQVAVDRATGVVEIERFAVAHDCGTIVNPTIVEGQIHGGVAQGVGAALYEEAVVDADGQPLTTTFMDYLLPTSATVPDIEIEHSEHPSPFIPGGMKGMGEGGTIGAPAAVVNAIAAALPDIAARLTQTPVTPARLWSLLYAPTTASEAGPDLD